MENTAKGTPKDVFLHLLIMITLYISVVSFITLLFQYINVAFPDQLNYYYQGIYDGIRWAVSALIVAFPLYIFLSWLFNKEITKDGGKREIKIRKWLVYLTLLISAVAMIVQLIRLVYNFLGGELTLAFALKLLSILIVAAGVFIYYFWDLRRDLATTAKQVKIIAWATGIIILATVIAGFFIAGSPQTQRQVRFDEQRVNDLQNIKSQIITYWQKKQILPTNLAGLTDTVSGFTAPTDPLNKAAYEYKVNSGLTFELCATFQQPSLGQNSAVARPIEPYGEPTSIWQHQAGRTCFSTTIDPELYKLTPGQPNNIPVK